MGYAQSGPRLPGPMEQAYLVAEGAQLATFNAATTFLRVFILEKFGVPGQPNVDSDTIDTVFADAREGLLNAQAKTRRGLRDYMHGDSDGPVLVRESYEAAVGASNACISVLDYRNYRRKERP